MTPPAFWQPGRTPPWPLAWLSRATTLFTAFRVARPGWTADVPVICCGNATAGGTGKTPLALDLGQRLLARGESVAFLSRGHGGSLRTATRLTPANAAQAGDEAQLLMVVAPVYVGPDRAATARQAINDGATVLILDDGLQNPSLHKTLSLLVIDGGAGFGNGHVMPAGPLREPVASAAARCQAAVLIGDDATEAAAALPPGLPLLRARLTPDPCDLDALPRRLLAFAGIGRPAKFFQTLAETGHAPVHSIAFADHHPYTEPDLQRLRSEARRLDATLITTTKDFVRLPKPARTGIRTLRVGLAWDDPGEIESQLNQALNRALAR
jgi:tetraacyldisaccharide 4'-kinase